jgi:hypothetical protein
MSARTIVLDGHTEAVLLELSRKEQVAPDDLAARLLRRAIRAARPRPVYDIEALRAYAQEYAEEELALADSDPEHRAALLAEEDAA